MLVPRMIQVEIGPGHRLTIKFEDGTSGSIDLSGELIGIFEPLRDLGYFNSGQLNAELNTVSWPNGADLAPEFLYEECLSNSRAA